MGCHLLTRILCGLRICPQPDPSPGLPTHHENSSGYSTPRSQKSTSRNSRSLTKAKFKLSSTAIMNPRGPRFVSAGIFRIPSWLDRQAIEDFVKSVPEILRVRHLSISHRPEFNLLLDFTPGTDIHQVLRIPELNPIITIDHHELFVNIDPGVPNKKDYKVVSRVGSDPLTSSTPKTGTTRPYLKLDGLKEGHGDCRICRSEIDGPFSTPCWKCRSAVCHDCVRQHHQTALSDYQHFPAQCCAAVFHPDVAKGILSRDEHTEYKSRFEERFTMDPFYCPVPACSTLIPPRLVGKMENVVINCHACQAAICFSCRLLAHPDQMCTGRKAVDLSAFEEHNYKPCPRCSRPLEKIDGCNRVHCKCGVHMCWECGRSLAMCKLNPCAAEDDGGNGGDDNDDDDDDDDNDEDDEQDPDLADPLDILGCKHSFGPLLENQVPRHWMTASIPDWWDRDTSDRHIECMVCRSGTKPSKAGRVEEKWAQGRDWRVARRCEKCYLVVCGKCKEEVSGVLGR